MIRSRILKVSVSALLLILLVWTIDFGSSLLILRSIDPTYVSIALILSCLGIYISAWKWSILLECVGKPRSFIKLLKLFWISAFLNNFMPGRTGGDIVRAYGISGDPNGRIGSILSVIMDRVLNLLALIVIALIALCVNIHTSDQIVGFRTLTWTMGLGTAITFGFVIAWKWIGSHIIRFRVRNWMLEVKEAVIQLARHPSHVGFAFALSCFYQTTMIVGNYSIAVGLGIDAPIGMFFYLIPLTALITLLPISVNGFGIREGSYAVTFSFVGISSEASVALSIAATMCMMATTLVGGILYNFGTIQISTQSESAKTTTELSFRTSTRQAENI